MIKRTFTLQDMEIFLKLYKKTSGKKFLKKVGLRFHGEKKKCRGREERNFVCVVVVDCNITLNNSCCWGFFCLLTKKSLGLGDKN